MQEIREHQDPSAENDQTFNRSKTDSEKSDDEHYEPVHTKLGMVNEHSAFEDPEEEVKVEETTVNPLEQATVHEPDETQNLLQE